MNPKHESEAKKLDELLRNGGERHDAELRPFVEMADALTKDASTEAATMTPDIKAKQRAALISMTAPQPTPTPSVSPAPNVPETPVSKPRVPWFAWAGGALALASVAAFAIFILKPGSFSLPGSGNLPTPASIARFVIPEAHAADAFSLVAEKQDVTGVDPTTTFVVSSTVPITADELTQHLRLVPPVSEGPTATNVPVRVTSIGDQTFRVEPASTLEDGKVYRVEVLAAVQNGDGSQTARDFSWAIQTKNVFRVTSAVPSPDSSGVPVDTGIEVTMSMSGFEDIAPHFQIVPKVDGRFEVHGRSVAFVPAKPLAPGQVYTVTIAKGWKVAGSDRELANDVVIRFETLRPLTGGETETPTIVLGRSIVEGAPGKDVLVPVWLTSVNDPKTISITGYSLSLEDAKVFLAEESDIPWFAYETKKRGDIYVKYAKTQALTVVPDIQEVDYQTYLVLPKGVPAGRYLMKVQPKGGEASWFFMESTNVATYAMSDVSQTIIWAMNIETGKPLSNLPVAVKDVHATTDENGLAKFPTPAEIRSTSTEAAVIATIGDGALTSLIRFQKQRGWEYAYSFGREMNTDAVVSYLYLDRPLYHTSDTAKAFGVVQGRDSRTAASNVTLELSKGGFFDFYSWGTEKVYRKVGVVPDASGFFSASLDWSTLAPGYYTLSLNVDGKRVTLRSIEVRDFVKPAYTLEITTTKQAVYAGDEVTGEVRAMFFDGTPVGKMEISLEASGAASRQMTLTTDDSGRASFTVKTDVSSVDSYSIRSVSLNARPTDGEEANIWTMSSVTVWRSHASLEVGAKTNGNTATIEFLARRVDLTKAETGGGSDVLGDPIRSTPITGSIIEHKWERIEDGTHYDFIEKKVSPTYHYEQREREVGKVNLTTDQAGKATMTFPLADDVYYTVVGFIKDEKGVDEKGSTSFAKGWWTESSFAQTGVSLDLIPANRVSFHTGERITAEFRKDGALLQKAAAPAFLYVEASRGIRSTRVTNESSYGFEFSEAHIPNMRLYGVAFMGDGFVERQVDASFDSEDRLLTVTLTPDAASYAPGGKASVRVDAKKADGSPASNAHVAVGVVDEAVFAAAMTTGEEYPIGTLYTWVSDGILLRNTSHDSTANEFGYGGAEMGGGGGDAVRRNFKDTAAFETVTLDGNGSGNFTITLPDNITSWRMTAVAVTADRFAGSTQHKLPVTKPVFVDVVAPSPLLVADKPVLKLRAFGTGLPSGESLTYAVDAPTLGLKDEKVAGTAGTPSSVAIDTLVPGVHTMVIRVTSSKGTDAIEKKITVLASRFTRDEYVETELGPGTAFADPGETRESEVRFFPKNRASLLPQIRSLAYGYSPRVESRIAASLAQKLLRDLYNESPDASVSVSGYQKTSGGIAILPYASEDAELSSKVAAVAPDLFDRAQLSRYLWEIAQNPSVSREEAVRAVSGLAALGEPVLTQLKAYAALSDLNWHEELAVIRGLEASGDREVARSLFARLLAKGQEGDGRMMIRVAEDKRSNIEATAEAAALAQVFADPSASKLFAYLESQWSDEAMTDLDRIVYLSRVAPTLLSKDVTIGYTTGEPEQTLVLKDGYSQSVTMTAEEIKNFRATKVDGPAVAVFVRRVTSMPAQSRDITISRAYLKADGTPVADFSESDVVRIQLVPTWNDAAPDGCYSVRDHLPAGIAPLVNVYQYYYDQTNWYPTEVDGNAVTFVVCRYDHKTVAPVINYRARVVSRGTYLAEPAVMQSIDMPSVSALSGLQTVTIK